GIAVTAGTPAEFPIPTDSGRAKFGVFCPRCGVRLLHRIEAIPAVAAKAGALDARAALEPAGHIYTKSAQPWVTIPGDALSYPGMPEDGYGALIERWGEMNR
ncbi:MAG: GFA family protein, partial [Caulobacterales bacterium]|nr:GFA family protein [Caulobacterales bacterium]